MGIIIIQYLFYLELRVENILQETEFTIRLYIPVFPLPKVFFKIIFMYYYYLFIYRYLTLQFFQICVVKLWSGPRVRT